MYSIHVSRAPTASATIANVNMASSIARAMDTAVEDMVSMIMVVVMMMMMIVMMKMLKMSSLSLCYITRKEILLREHGGRILSLRLLQGIPVVNGAFFCLCAFLCLCISPLSLVLAIVIDTDGYID